MDWPTSRPPRFGNVCCAARKRWSGPTRNRGGSTLYVPNLTGAADRIHERVKRLRDSRLPRGADQPAARRA